MFPNEPLSNNDRLSNITYIAFIKLERRERVRTHVHTRVRYYERAP